MGRAIIWMVIFAIMVGGFAAILVAVIMAVDGKRKRREIEQSEIRRLEQERAEFLRREREGS